MCLAVPGKILAILNNDQAEVDFGGVKRTVNVSLLEEPGVGEFVLVHVGFAIQKVDPDRAAQNYQMFQKLKKTITS